MKVEFTDQAQKDMQGIGPVDRVRITLKLDAYAAAPSSFRHQVKKLQGTHALRLRIGNYRVLFDEDGVVLRVLRVGHRREIYR